MTYRYTAAPAHRDPQAAVMLIPDADGTIRAVTGVRVTNFRLASQEEAAAALRDHRIAFVAPEHAAAAVEAATSPAALVAGDK